MEVRTRKGEQEEVEKHSAQWMTVNKLAELFTLADKLTQPFIDKDLNFERNLKFSRDMAFLLVPYKEIYKVKQWLAK